MNIEKPHRVVDELLDRVAGGARDILNQATGALSQAGATVQAQLDMPWKSINGPEQPLRAVDRLVDGTLKGAASAAQGGLQRLSAQGEVFMRTMDHPLEQPDRLGRINPKSFLPRRR